jgi:hypothetical protein
MVMVAALTLGLGPALESLVLSGGPGPRYPATSPPAYDSLASISCTGSDDCWAWGADALAHWSGGGWTSIPVTSGFGPEGITCVSDADCWAVGQRFAGIGAGLSAVSAAHSVVEHLTAGGWTRVSAPGTSYPLTDVACVTASDCWGLGSVIEHWSGDGGRAVPSPAGEGTNSSLSAVTCAGVDECWAVGSTTTDGNESAEAPMAGVLIYTAAGDAEGTMGGLVRMGRPGYLEPAIPGAVETALWCSADPVCMEIGTQSGQSPDSCNLAACHNCCLVPETACEEFNRFLDRGVVVGSVGNPQMGFFNP